MYELLENALKGLLKHEGVVGHIIIRTDRGVPIHSSFSEDLTSQYSYLATTFMEEVLQLRLYSVIDLTLQTSAMVKRLKDKDELISIRIRY